MTVEADREALVPHLGLDADVPANWSEPVWDADAAADYDAWFETRWGRYAYSVEAKVLRSNLGRLSGTRVLDVGCGTGRFGMLLRDADATVVGLDLSLGMVMIARDRLAHVVVGDGQRLPFSDGTFDVTLAVTVLEFVDDPARMLTEMARVTTPDGTIMIGTLNPVSAWGWAHRRELQGPPWTTARFLTRDDLVALAAGHGYADTTEGLYAPGWLPGLASWGPALEWLGRRVKAPGAFRVLRIRRR